MLHRVAKEQPPFPLIPDLQVRAILGLYQYHRDNPAHVRILKRVYSCAPEYHALQTKWYGVDEWQDWFWHTSIEEENLRLTRDSIEQSYEDWSRRDRGNIEIKQLIENGILVKE